MGINYANGRLFIPVSIKGDNNTTVIIINLKGDDFAIENAIRVDNIWDLKGSFYTTSLHSVIAAKDGFHIIYKIIEGKAERFMYAKCTFVKCNKGREIISRDMSSGFIPEQFFNYDNNLYYIDFKNPNSYTGLKLKSIIDPDRQIDLIEGSLAPMPTITLKDNLLYLSYMLFNENKNKFEHFLNIIDMDNFVTIQDKYNIAKDGKNISFRGLSILKNKGFSSKGIFDLSNSINPILKDIYHTDFKVNDNFIFDGKYLYITDTILHSFAIEN